MRIEYNKNRKKGVPMPTLGSITKTIRINPKDLEVIEGLMEDGTSWSGAIHKLCEGVPIASTPKESVNSEGVPKEEYEKLKEEVEKYNTGVYRELESYCDFFGVSKEEFIGEVIKSMQSGEIMYEDGRIKTYGDVDLSRFKEVCHDKGVPIEKAIEKCTQMILRS